MKLSCDLSPLKGAVCPYYDEWTNGDAYPCEDDICCPLQAAYETGDEEKMRIIRDRVLQDYEGDDNASY